MDRCRDSPGIEEGTPPRWRTQAATTPDQLVIGTRTFLDKGGKKRRGGRNIGSWRLANVDGGSEGGHDGDRLPGAAAMDDPWTEERTVLESIYGDHIRWVDPSVSWAGSGACSLLGYGALTPGLALSLRGCAPPSGGHASRQRAAAAAVMRRM